MAKLGWVAFALVGALLVLGVAASSSREDQVVQRLDEIKGLIKLDIHRRSYQHHDLFSKCDLGRACKTYEISGRLHELEKLKHDYEETCEELQACKDRDLKFEKQKADVLKQLRDREK